MNCHKFSTAMYQLPEKVTRLPEASLWPLPVTSTLTKDNHIPDFQQHRLVLHGTFFRLEIAAPIAIVYR